MRTAIYPFGSCPFFNQLFFFFMEKINLISLIVVKSIKALTITEHTVLQYHNRS